MKLHIQEDIKKLLTPMPRRFCVRYALLVCNDILHLITHKDSINALQVTQDWLDYKATDEQVREAANAAYAAANAANAANAAGAYAYAAAYYATSAAYYAAYATSSYAAYATISYPKEYDIKIDEYYKLCISIMSPLERELFLNTGDNEND